METPQSAVLTALLQGNAVSLRKINTPQMQAFANRKWLGRKILSQAWRAWQLLYKGAKFEAKEYLPTRSVAFDEVKSSEGRARRLFEQLVLC